MSPVTRVKLLILVLLPALSVPRGTRLDWCVCTEPVEDDCCVECCEGEPSDGPAYEDPASPDCCKHLEVDDFDEILTVSAAQVPAPVFTCATRPARVLRPVGLASRRRGGRAPPLIVTPPGLLPGAAPLRL